MLDEAGGLFRKVRVVRGGAGGVGIVKEPVSWANEFKVMTPEGESPCLDVLKYAAKYRETAHDPETTEYFVRVEWLDAVPMEKAIDEVGLFGNQNTVCRPNDPKWRHTVERLKTYYKKVG